MRKLVIGNRQIDHCSDAYVIAEIGHNHGGRLDTAIRMIDAAAECGCDAVKFQSRNNRAIYTKAFYNSPYASRHAFGGTYGEHREALELCEHDYLQIRQRCRDRGVHFLATAFDCDSVDMLLRVGVQAIKIASGDLTNTPLIAHAASTGLPLVLSTGGATVEDMTRADFLLSGRDAAFLHCVAQYPTPPERCNLRAIEQMALLLWDRVIGYSCHYNGIVMAEAAYLLGARIIEKHFTLDHTAKGSDHALSLQPDGMRRMVRDLRRVRHAMGTGAKERTKEEACALSKMEKVLYVTRPLSAGHVLTDMDLAALSPATPEGLRPWCKEQLVGRTLVLDASTDEPISFDMVGGEA